MPQKAVVSSVVSKKVTVDFFVKITKFIAYYTTGFTYIGYILYYIHTKRKPTKINIMNKSVSMACAENTFRKLYKLYIFLKFISQLDLKKFLF